MRPIPVFAIFLAACPPLPADPPVNDNFSSRTVLAGTSATITLDDNITNDEAGTEPGENTRSGTINAFGATLWWTWQAPIGGWVKLDTEGSMFDTVLQISTGATLDGQTILAFNDQAPGSGSLGTSSITFLALAGATYNIAVGGWDSFLPETGAIAMRLAMGSAATPAYFPALLSFNPSSPDVTGGPVPVIATFMITSESGSGAGVAGVGFGWEAQNGDGEFIGQPAAWNGAQPVSVPMTFTARQHSHAGVIPVWFKIIPDDEPGSLIFSGPDGGSGYALPSSVAVAKTIQVTSNCPANPADQDAPELTAFTITPDNATVTSAPAALQISATVTDPAAGAGSVKVTLKSGTDVHDLVASLVLTSGTIHNGVWTGSLAVPKLYPSDNYSVLVECIDTVCNESSFGQRGTSNIPGAPNGTIDVAIVGGGDYERWAWTYKFSPDDTDTAMLDDADGDGNANLLSYAFRMDPRNTSVSPGFFPTAEITGTGDGRKLRMTYLRRKNPASSGLTYSPQFTSGPSGIWQTVSGGTVTSVSASWEKVVIDDAVTTGAASARFGRVKVEYTAP